MSYSPIVVQLSKEYIGKSTASLAKWKSSVFLKLVEETNFLPTHANTRQRMWHVLNDSVAVPLCDCGSIVNWVQTYKPPRYAQFCSVACGSINSNTINKRKRTCVDRYGVDSFSKTNNFKAMIHSVDPSTWDNAIKKRDITNMARYGTTNPSNSPDSIEKRKATNIERYGHTNVLASEMVRQIKIEKHGTDAATMFDGFVEKRRNSMIERHGVEYSGQSPVLLAALHSTCLSRYGSTNYNQSLMDRSVLDKLNDREWLIDQHLERKIPLSQIGMELGVDLGTIRSRCALYGIDTVRHSVSYPESEIAKLLDSSGIAYKQNDRRILNGKELDFVIESHRVAIEYCGLYWHSSAHARNTPSYHVQKMKGCNSAGYRLITIFEDEWVHSKELVKAKLLNILGVSGDPVVFARNTVLSDVCRVDKIDFFNRCHIQGSGPGSITIGLKSDDRYVAMMSFIKQGAGVYTLNRYATSCVVPGGFSKLLSAFEKNNKWNKIVSFADLRWSEGGVYDKMGFKLDKILLPDYQYVDTTNITRIHKFNFRHSNLPNVLGEKYDPTVSETTNTHKANWFKIYNCGLLRYTKTNRQ